MPASQYEFDLMKKYIEEHCGIYLKQGKEYLVESRLNDLMIETACKSLQEFYFKAQNEKSGKLKDRITDAMTTNETFWFRDDPLWSYIKEETIPFLLDRAEKEGSVRILSAAASTGQEAYSLLMLLDEAVKLRRTPELLDKIEIIGTDISSTSIFSAISARYSSFAMKRGLPEDKKRKYFSKSGDAWVYDQELKKRVTFKLFNLQNSFASLGTFDLILCRYVVIYFSDTFKKELFSKLAEILKPGCVLILGAGESLKDYTDAFDISYHNKVTLQTRKQEKK